MSAQPQRSTKTAARKRSPIPPHTNPEAERGVLGGVLIAPAEMDGVADMLTPDDFEMWPCRNVYTAILAVHESGRPVDVVLVDAELQRTRTLDDRGAFAHELVDTCSNCALTQQYARVVLENSVARQRLAIYSDLMCERITWQQAGELYHKLDARLDAQVSKDYTMADLMAEELPDVRWIVPGLIPEGLALLAAKLKIGKSWMALALCIAVACGGVFLGTRVEQGDALYLAVEDSKRRLRTRTEKLLAGDRAPAALHPRVSWPRLDQGGLSQLDRWLRSHPSARLVVVDVLQKVRPPHGKNADAYAEDYTTMGALKALADRYYVAFVVVHHTRKAAADDVYDEIHGSTALGGAADTVLVLTRNRGESEGKLHAAGRDVEQDMAQDLTFDPDTCAWRPLSEAELAQRREQRMSPERREIVRVLREAGHSLRPLGIALALGIAKEDKRGQERIRALLGKMVDAKEIINPATGVYDLVGERSQRSQRSQSASDADSEAPEAFTVPFTVRSQLPDAADDVDGSVNDCEQSVNACTIATTADDMGTVNAVNSVNGYHAGAESDLERRVRELAGQGITGDAAVRRALIERGVAPSELKGA